MSIQENIHNYYEKMVAEELKNKAPDVDEDSDFFADVACVALNRLPPRYFRHEVDMAFYLSISEQLEMHKKVETTVNEALQFVTERKKQWEAEEQAASLANEAAKAALDALRAETEPQEEDALNLADVLSVAPGRR